NRMGERSGRRRSQCESELSFRGLFGDGTPPHGDRCTKPSIGGSAVKEERRILIVDDDRDSTHLLKSLLEKIGGYHVLEENDAAKAHQTAHNFGPDLILLDIMMPQRDGVELASEIDADPQLQRTTIIFLTALGDPRAGLRIQGHPVLAKPINVPELINRLEENLPAR